MTRLNRNQVVEILRLYDYLKRNVSAVQSENSANALKRHLSKLNSEGAPKHCSVHQRNTADALAGRILQGFCATERFLLTGQ